MGQENAKHLINVLKEHYQITTDWSGAKYLGLDLDWDYEKREVHLSMWGYIKKVLIRFQHEPPKLNQIQPYPHVPVKYREKVQYVQPDNNSPLLDKEAMKIHHASHRRLPVLCTSS